MCTLERTDVSAIARHHLLPEVVVRDIAARVFWAVYRQHLDARGAPITTPRFEAWFGPAPLAVPRAPRVLPAASRRPSSLSRPEVAMFGDLLDQQNVADPITDRAWRAVQRCDGVPVQISVAGGTSADVQLHGCVDPAVDPLGVALLDAAVTVAAGASLGHVVEWWPYLAATVPAVAGTPDVRVRTAATLSAS